MRGFPPTQIFVLGLLFALLAVPLCQLTGQRAGSSAPTQTSPQSNSTAIEPVMALLRLRYAHKPTSVSLKMGGVDLLAKLDLSSTPAETEMKLAPSPEGHEFMITAEWPEGTPDTALTLEIEPEGYDLRSETRWSSGSTLNETLTFIWK
jgi:hypothetical protein